MLSSFAAAFSGLRALAHRPLMGMTAMHYKSSRITFALALTGTVVTTTGSALAQQAAPAPADQPTCEEHRFALTVGSPATEASARSCLHPDGILDVVQRTPGLPVQAFHVTPADVACGGAGQSSCSGPPA